MRIGIICSIPEEIKHFNLSKNSGKTFGGKIFYKKKIDSKQLVIVESGIGKVNAAITSTLLIQEFKCDLLIFSGIAGSIDPLIEIGDVILGEKLLQYDYGTLENGRIRIFPAGTIPMGSKNRDIYFKLDKNIKKMIRKQLPDLMMGKIISGDTFVNCNISRKYFFKKFGAQVVDMEGGAVAQVSKEFGINAVIIRSVSDLAGAGKKRMSQKNITQAAKNSFKTVEKILKIF